MEQSKRAVFGETFRYKNLVWMELWKESLGETAVEVMLSGEDTEDI